MQLTAYSDYSLRVLMYLGARELAGHDLSSIAEIARAFKISRNHLTKVVHHLGQRGFIETVRGRGGGIRLAKPPKKIRIGAVYRSTERFALAPCFDNKDCSIVDACALKGVLDEALDSFITTLDAYTLADLLEKKRAPRAVLMQIVRAIART